MYNYTYFYKFVKSWGDNYTLLKEKLPNRKRPGGEENDFELFGK